MRAGSNDYQPGDAIPPDGGILVGGNAIMHSGIAYVTKDQAQRAEKYGWRKVYGRSLDRLLVRIER